MKAFRCPRCHHGLEAATKPLKCPRCGQPGMKTFAFPKLEDDDAKGETCEAPGVFAAGGSLVASLSKLSKKRPE